MNQVKRWLLINEYTIVMIDGFIFLCYL